MNSSISIEMLLDAAKTKSGSRDIGAWLFVSLLRSVGVEARLVCSLQPLQFGFLNEGPRQEFYDDSANALKATEMQKQDSHISISSTGDSAPSTSKIRNPQFPSSAFRETGIYITPAEYIARTKTFSPHHPYFWCEAWDVASQRWICVEPMVGPRLNQPSKIEPPVSAAAWEAGAVGDNLLSYVVGFDSGSRLKIYSNEAGFAKDVTIRYAKAYYSKTFRYRLESQGGGKWLGRIMGYLDRLEPLVHPTLNRLIIGP
jgi:xeroderma pigmentosum group C-complementing protein